MPHCNPTFSYRLSQFPMLDTDLPPAEKSYGGVSIFFPFLFPPTHQIILISTTELPARLDAKSAMTWHWC